MKDSGTEWIARIPEHWSLGRIAQLGRLSKANGGSKKDEKETGIPCVRYGDLYTTHSHFIREINSFVDSETATEYTQIHYGDVLFAASGETLEEIGKSAVNLTTDKACCGGDLIVLKPAKAIDDPVFLGYALDCSISAAQKATMGRGFTVVHIYADQLKNLTIAIPPAQEQQLIGAALERETARIDALIAKKTRFIKLLKEKRQVLITQAVTKGLDPKVKMKDSGVEWIGEVPAHWQVMRLTKCIGPIVDYRGRTPTKVDKGQFLVTAKNVRGGKIDYECSKEYVAPHSARQLLERGGPEIGDLLFTMEAPLGQVAQIDRTDIALAQRIVKFRALETLLKNEFLLFWIMGSYCQAVLETLATGSTALGIKASKLGMIPVFLPPLDEQVGIIRFLQVECGGPQVKDSFSQKLS
nr:restriction endonuclease subunit S [Thiorhodococcus mannitoliphagus]